MRPFLDYLNDVAMGAEPRRAAVSTDRGEKSSREMNVLAEEAQPRNKAERPTAPHPFPVCKMLYEDSPTLSPAKKGAVNRESQPPTPTWVGSLEEELASERFLEAEGRE